MRIFQSTLLMRGATRCRSRARQSANFNPRSSCEERLLLIATLPDGTRFQSTLLMRGATTMGYVSKVRKDISIHAPHARSDPALFAVLAKFVGISIHAPHARSDSFDTGMMSPYVNFNPRSSCEERPQVVTARCSAQNFNPRSSCEERRARARCGLWRCKISIHAPHARSDWDFFKLRENQPIFQSTLLMRGATSAAWLDEATIVKFQSTLLMRGATTIVAHTLSRC